MIRFNEEDRKIFQAARFVNVPGKDIAPNALKFNEEWNYYFLIASEGQSGDYSINQDALEYLVERDCLAVVLLGDRRDERAAADVTTVWEAVRGKPLAPGVGGHGWFWWVNRDFKYRSSTIPREAVRG